MTGLRGSSPRRTSWRSLRALRHCSSDRPAPCAQASFTSTANKEDIIDEYHFSLTIRDTFSSVVTKVRQALQDHGFGVLTEIDVAATFKQKLDLDRGPYLILGACNPQYAHQALTADPAIGVLLPCNVVVRENGKGATVVDFMDPSAVLSLVHQPGVAKVAHDVRSLLEQVRDAVATA